MTRFAGHKDITNFVQRNQFADKIGAAGMNAYADQTAMNFDAERATVNAGVMGEARVAMAEQDAKAIKAGAQAQAQSSLIGAGLSGLSSIAGGAFGGGGGGGLGGYNGSNFGTFGGSGTGSISGYTPRFNGAGLFG